MRNRGFTAVEIVVVISIIAVLASIVFAVLHSTRGKTYYARALSEYETMAFALDLYQNDNDGEYPADTNRDVPPGLEEYLAGGQNENWPNAPWPGSVYDWDNWQDPDDEDLRIYQISIRFCPLGGSIDTCNFPDEEWAENFGVNSAVYYCVEGACRAHQYEPIDYPAYCVNCGVE
jgi:prepilin-type N-terminal cleavage/methylation domain-containing protein